MFFTNITPDLSYFNYTWDFGDSSLLSSEAEPSHSYAEAGDYTVTITATNACGRSVSNSKVVTIQPSAVPTINYKTTICSSDTAIFKTPVSCTNLTWSVTEGTILSGQNTDEIQVAFGTGEVNNGIVTLDATNCGGNPACEFPLELEIPIIPTVIAIKGDTLVCPSTDIKYTLANRKIIPGLYYTWSVVGGTITSVSAGYDLDSVEVSWTTANTIGQLTVATSHELLDSCVATITQGINILPPFKINQVFGSQCGSSTLQLSTNKGVDFTWEILANNHSISNTGLITWTNIEEDIKAWTVPNQVGLYCNVVDTISLSLFEKPVLDSIAGETLVDTITTYAYTPISAYTEGSMNWFTPGGAYAGQSGMERSVIWKQATPFSVTGTYRTPKNCASDPFVLNIEKDLVFKITGSDTSCVGDSILYTLNHDTVSNTTYTWKFDNQIIDLTARTGKVKLTGSGTKTLEATINRAGRIYTASKQITVQALSSSLSLKGENLIKPAGGGTYEYIIVNPEALLLDIQVQGDQSHAFANDSVLTVTWNSAGPYAIDVIGSKVGETCNTVPRHLSITKAPALTGVITQSASSQLCLNKNTVYQFNADQYTEDVVWSISGGGTITVSSKANATVNWAFIPGTYTLSVNYNRFGAQTVSQQVVIAPLPNPVIRDTVICGEEMTPILTTKSYAGYKWTRESDNKTVAKPL